MKNNFGISSLGFLLPNRGLSKKTIRKIEANNFKNKGVVYYEPSQIEAFFDDGEPLGGMLLSGGYSSIRNRCIIRAIECAYLQGYSVAVLHGGNRELENMLTNYLAPLNLLDMVNEYKPYYDPFLGLSNSEIIQYILSSAKKEYNIGAMGRYYLNGVTEFIRSKRIQPYIDMYITCPHFRLVDKVNAAESNGQISSNEARNILSQILQGESEKGSIESFFSSLSVTVKSATVLPHQALSCNNRDKTKVYDCIPLYSIGFDRTRIAWEWYCVKWDQSYQGKQQSRRVVTSGRGVPQQRIECAKLVRAKRHCR